jgi:hypothetical protein
MGGPLYVQFPPSKGTAVAFSDLLNSSTFNLEIGCNESDVGNQNS